MNKVSIIGAGNMGAALYRKIKSMVFDDRLFLCDRNKEKLQNLKAILHSTDTEKALAFGDLIIIAVKPQSFDELCKSIKTPLKNKVVLSIMAGIPIKTIQKKMGAKKVVRSLPNLPLQVNAGVTLWKASKEVTDDEKEVVQSLFKSFGAEIELEKEQSMDGLIGISSSGPAYFFYLTELLAESAKKFGLPPEDAQKIAAMTFVGSAKLLAESSRSPGEWREAVCSKGGITEAALKHLRQEKFDSIFADALEAAKKRSEELSG